MAKYELGEIRRSQILQNGPGSVVDFRAGEKGGGPVSVVTTGLEHWEKTAKVFPPLNNDPNVIFEPRLQAKLKKTHFRMSPVKLEGLNEEDSKYKPHILGARFPRWLVCPSCDRLGEAKEFQKEIGDPSRWCGPCSNETGRRVHVVPVRFVTACEKGHLSDFPWQFYFSRTAGKIKSHRPVCPEQKHRLYLRSDGNSSGLESLYLYCSKCRGTSSIGAIFQKSLLQSIGVKCSGERPWIGDREDCSAELRTIQRGASNVYFPKIESALSIPPWDNPLEERLTIDWNILRDQDKETRDNLIQLLASGTMMDADELIEIVDRRLEYNQSSEEKDLKKEEYLNFVEAPVNPDESSDLKSEFRVRKQTRPRPIEDFIENLVKVERLKEVRVQTGFSRITAPTPKYDPDDELALSKERLNWLPASVVRGEGVFFNLSKKRTSTWRMQPAIIERTDTILQAFRERLEQRDQKYEEQEIRITPEFILIHSLSHMLINQFALNSGYNAASIKERIYCGGDKPEMNGVLIFTGTSDSDGTLGGLARLAEPNLFGKLIVDAIEEAQWCSSDPICSDGIISHTESMNNAACHSCLLLPETSCEQFNCFLDRAFVVGLPHDRQIGYFSGLFEVSE